MTMALKGSEGSASRPGRSLPPGKTRYPLYGRLGGPQGRSGQVQRISPPPGFYPRTVQPVASHYTDYATQRMILLGAHHILHVSRVSVKGFCSGILHSGSVYVWFLSIISYPKTLHFRNWSWSCPQVQMWGVSTY